MKDRQTKLDEYDEEFHDIPRDYKERLSYIYDHYKFTPKDQETLLVARETTLACMQPKQYKIVLYENPEGKPRPRFAVNRSNVIANTGRFVHTYSLVGAEDKHYMKMILQGSKDAEEFNSLIHYPCIAQYDVYQKTPSSFNKIDVMLAELGLKIPVTKPDWDNIGKKYSDMSNDNLWEDDRLVSRGVVNKWYSILPRVEITLTYLGIFFHRSQINNTLKDKYNNLTYLKQNKVCII